MFALKEKKSLFGGALRCAGLAGAAMVASSATAGLSPMSQYAQIVAYGVDDAYFNLTDYTFAAPGTLTASYTGLQASSYWDSSQLLTGANITQFDPGLWDFLGVHVATQFILGETHQVRLEWDLTGASGASARVTGYFGTYLFEMNNSDFLANPVGSIVLTLEGGEFYNFILNLGANADHTGPAFIRFVEVPAPSALALLGFGMIGTRRRRSV